MKNKTILVLIILIGLGSNIFGQEKFRKMAYLVQSVGSQIYTQNGVTTDVPAELLAYNIANNYTGEDSCTIYNPTDDYPPGGNRLWEWKGAFYDEGTYSFKEDYLDTETYSIIMIKHCFASQSDIWSYGEPSDTINRPYDQTIYNFQWYARKIARKMEQYPQKFFVWWNIPPIVPTGNNPDDAARLRWFNKWMVDTLQTGLDTLYGAFPPNVYIYDYFELVDSANFLPLSLSDSPTDSHPNEACTELVAPDFVQKAFNAAINYELSGVTFQLTVPIQDGWNLVSIPGLHPLNQNVNTWWINKDPSTDVFRYNGIYQTVTAVAPGLGYMMKHNNSQVYNTGDEWPASGIQIVPHDPIAGTAGWNLFGGYELSVTAANVTTNPPGLQSSPIYKFSGGYQIATTIDPGYGYWINLTAPGQIIIPETLEKNGKSAEWFPNDWGRLITTDAAGKSFTLYAVNGKVNLDNYKMPPTPPTGNFDIRYSSGRIAEDINSSVKAIDMSGVTYPLTVRVEGMDIRLLDESGKRINTNLKSGEDVVISDATIQKLMVSGELLPTVYSLEQNYPNPFNPSTKISWQSPVGSWQSLKIYDVLGNEVSTFVDEYKPAGSYEVEWDASDYPSGVYFYQLRAKNFIETKKMILLR